MTFFLVEAHSCWFFLRWYNASYHHWSTHSFNLFWNSAICRCAWYLKHTTSSQLLSETTKLCINVILAMLIILSKPFAKIAQMHILAHLGLYLKTERDVQHVCYERIRYTWYCVCVCFVQIGFVIYLSYHFKVTKVDTNRFRYKWKHAWTTTIV